MHVKFRDGRALLYRSTWIRKGAAGNTHGYKHDTYVGSLPVESATLPEELAKELSSDEQALVMKRVVEPTQARHALLEHQAAERDRDPNWRVEEASRLLTEAAERAGQRSVDRKLISTAEDALAQVRATVVSRAGERAVPREDPLRDALSAIERAAIAVSDGRYGRAPRENVRMTPVYATWSAIVNAVNGDGARSLVRVLQTEGWVKSRGR